MFHTVRTVVFKHKAAKYHNFSVKLVWEVSLDLVKKNKNNRGDHSHIL